MPARLNAQQRSRHTRSADARPETCAKLFLFGKNLLQNQRAASASAVLVLRRARSRKTQPRFQHKNAGSRYQRTNHAARFPDRFVSDWLQRLGSFSMLHVGWVLCTHLLWPALYSAYVARPSSPYRFIFL